MNAKLKRQTGFRLSIWTTGFFATMVSIPLWILTVFYFVVLGPFAVVLRWRSDPLAIKRGAPRGWRARVEETPAAHAARQF